MVFIQFILMYLLRNESWPVLLLVAYCLGGVINHSLMLGELLKYFHNDIITFYLNYFKASLSQTLDKIFTAHNLSIQI